jgi:hypothetical protein
MLGKVGPGGGVWQKYNKGAGCQPARRPRSFQIGGRWACIFAPAFNFSVGGSVLRTENKPATHPFRCLHGQEFSYRRVARQGQNH